MIEATVKQIQICSDLKYHTPCGPSGPDVLMVYERSYLVAGQAERVVQKFPSLMLTPNEAKALAAQLDAAADELILMERS